MTTFLWILFIIIGILAGFAVGVWVTRNQMKKVLLDNPPLNEDAVRMMMSSMGRKPSEVQVKQVFRQIKAAAKNAENK